MYHGISFYPKNGGDYDAVFKAADTSLYQAKEKGRDTYFYVVGSSNIELLKEMEGEQHEV
ncbi:diguanylate cyclase domain-containing protein [Ornithinibacillus contaminans]|uniref:diguanylate cyclase domain-containing protein n=1 Tax=Ornithinibacillus contaminans TaxID=694055 RepID=UPI0012EE12F3